MRCALYEVCRKFKKKGIETKIAYLFFAQSHCDALNHKILMTPRLGGMINVLVVRSSKVTCSEKVVSFLLGIAQSTLEKQMLREGKYFPLLPTLPFCLQVFPYMTSLFFLR